jgi:hypothetical protein
MSLLIRWTTTIVMIAKIIIQKRWMNSFSRNWQRNSKTARWRDSRLHSETTGRIPQCWTENVACGVPRGNGSSVTIAIIFTTDDTNDAHTEVHNVTDDLDDKNEFLCNVCAASFSSIAAWESHYEATHVFQCHVRQQIFPCYRFYIWRSAMMHSLRLL